MGKLISIAQVAERLGLARITVYRMAEDGRIPSVKLGSRRLIAEETVAKIVASALPEGV
ncbi:MAG TPA: excisionase family DNA-binding protein [Rectinemataceae bacterium]|nr:excisionase family DNA-binding protein [Rectinemataceae bacterium]